MGNIESGTLPGSPLDLPNWSGASREASAGSTDPPIPPAQLLKMARIYVGNLPLDIRTKDIDDLFYKYWPFFPRCHAKRCRGA